MGTVAHPPVTARTRRLLALLLVPLLGATVAGAGVLWPTGDGVALRQTGERVEATVSTATVGPCADDASGADERCVRVEALVSGGGRVALEELPAEEVGGLRVGDEIVAHRQVSGSDVSYRLAGQERSAPLALLVAAVAVLVGLVARWRGLWLLAALAATSVVLTVFVVPAVLDGAEPVAAGMVGAALIATLLLAVGHGVSARTATALVGCLLGVAVVGVTAELVAEAAELGRLGGAPAFLDVGAGTVPLQGLLVAGLLVGTVGGLAELSLRLVDATWDLGDTDPGAGWFGVARAGVRRGRDHLTAVTGTLVLAYAGAALPVLVLLSAGDQRVVDAVQGEVLGVEVVRALVAVLALGATGPITAAVAAAVVVGEARRPSAGDPRRFRSRHERRLWEDDET